MTKDLAKNIIGGVVSSYQAILAIEIPDITENYTKFAGFHLSTLGIYNAYLNIQVGHIVGMFDDWPACFRFGRTRS